MPSSSTDRLSARDLTFLLGETPATPMHVATVQIFQRGRLATEDGGIDFESIRKAAAARLHRIPRTRQKVRWTPLLGQPVWVDDRDFNLAYHVRHTSLPRPGSREQLRRLVARLMAQPLDRRRPLWEMWVVEGLEDERFALVGKVHHCLVDGVSGLDPAPLLLSPTPEQRVGEAPRFVPRPVPGGLELLCDELLHRATLPLRALGELRARRRDPVSELRAGARAAVDRLAGAVRPPSETPINGKPGPHRRFDWGSLALADVKAVHRAAGCSLHDVVLTTVTGALREYLSDRGADPARLDFRVAVPVGVPGPDERGRPGHRVSSWTLRLPLGEASPRARLEAVYEATQSLRRRGGAATVATLMGIPGWTPPVLLSLGTQAVSGRVSAVVINVPGPQRPLHLLGARLLEMVPVPPLLPGVGLAIALFSYDGTLSCGLLADYDLMPDLGRFPGILRRAFVELAAALGVEVEATGPVSR